MSIAEQDILRRELSKQMKMALDLNSEIQKKEQELRDLKRKEEQLQQTISKVTQKVFSIGRRETEEKLGGEMGIIF